MKRPTFEFKSACASMLLKLGATGDDMLRLDTVAGPLDLTPFDTWLAGRFDDVQRAKAVLGKDARLNPFSGKWNFHPRPVDADAVAAIEAELRRLLPSTALAALMLARSDNPVLAAKQARLLKMLGDGK